MTDTPEVSEPDTPDGDWTDAADGASYPEYPDNPHNHRYTISIDSRGPMLVFRANTSEDIKEACEELEDPATGAALGRAWAAMKAGAALGSGLQATPAPAAPQMPPQGMPQVPAPPVAYAPAATPPPPAPAVSNRGAEYAGAGWYRLNVPYKDKATFDAITTQYGMRKGRPSEGGQFSFHKDTKAWYVSPEYAGAFPQFSPVPA